MKKTLYVIVLIVFLLCGCSHSSTQLFNIEDSIVNKDDDALSVMSVYSPALESGSCVVITLPTDEIVLVDCGSTMDFPVLYEKLKDNGINIIDHIILTSSGDYSLGGIEKIINNFEVCNVYISDDAQDTEVYNKVKKYCSTNNVMFSKVCEGSRIYDFGEVSVDVVSSEKYFFGKEIDSISLYVLLGEVGIFIEGECDISSQAKMASELRNFIDSDIYFITSNGAQSEKSGYLVEEISPLYTVIRTHSGQTPLKTVTDKLKASELLRNDVNGDIVFTIEKDKINLKMDSQ